MITPLVGALDEQIAKGTYNFDFNMWLIKLYQFYPDQVQSEVVSKVLLKALMALPSNDFSTAMYVVPPDAAVSR